jgi:hypothetical protein
MDVFMLQYMLHSILTLVVSHCLTWIITFLIYKSSLSLVIGCGLEKRCLILGKGEDICFCHKNTTLSGALPVSTQTKTGCCYSDSNEPEGWNGYLITTSIMYGSTTAAVFYTYSWDDAQISTSINLLFPLSIWNLGWNSLLHSENLTLELNYFTFFFLLVVYWLWLVGVPFCRNLNAN